MNKVSNKLKQLFFPDVTATVRREIDCNNTRTMYLLSVLVTVTEILALTLFFIITGDLGNYDYVFATIFCLVACVSCLLAATAIRREDEYPHGRVAALTVWYFAVMAAWGIAVSCRQYLSGGQMVTFFAVIICFVCFISYRPVAGCVLIFLSFAGMYTALWFLDHASRLNIYHYAVAATLAAAGMIARYHREIRLIEGRGRFSGEGTDPGEKDEEGKHGA